MTPSIFGTPSKEMTAEMTAPYYHRLTCPLFFASFETQEHAHVMYISVLFTSQFDSLVIGGLCQ